MKDSPLSPRHQRFVAEYLRDGNATQAYVRAGYSARGAQSCASRLLAQPHIESALAAGRQRLAQALEVTVERVIQEYARIAFAPVDAELDHGKALQATRLKLQALAVLTRHLNLFAGPAKAGLTHEHRERYETTLAAARLAGAPAESEPLQSMATSAPHEGPPPEPQPLQSMATSAPIGPMAFLPSPRDGQGPRTAPREKVPSVSEADEGLPSATTNTFSIEMPLSPSSALRAPSPRMRGEKEDSVSGRSRTKHAQLVRGSTCGREFVGAAPRGVGRQPDGPRGAWREDALAFMVGELVQAHATRIERHLTAVSRSSA